MALKPADIYDEVARLHREGVAGVVATVVAVGGSTPRGAGAKMIVYPDGRTLGSVGGGAIESTAIERARELAGTREPVLLSFDLEDDTGMVCGGQMDIFLEPVAASPMVLVIGGGHVGQAVAAAAKLAGFRVDVVDDRAEVVTAERFPSVDRRFVGGTELLGGDLKVDGSTFVVVVTRGHRFDRDWIEALVGTGPEIPRHDRERDEGAAHIRRDGRRRSAAGCPGDDTRSDRARHRGGDAGRDSRERRCGDDSRQARSDRHGDAEGQARVQGPEPGVGSGPRDAKKVRG